MNTKLSSGCRYFDHLENAAARFAGQGRVGDLREYGSGNVHDTFLVTPASGAEKRFILQRMNTHVFQRPELVMKNIRAVTDHIGRRLLQDPAGSGRRWEVPLVLLTAEADDHWVDPGGAFWRAFAFIDAAQPFDTVQDEHHAAEIGYALGFFHRLISDLAPADLADTLEGFHITPRHLRHFDEVVGMVPGPRSSECLHAISFVGKRRALANVLEEARSCGRLQLRIIHGDPKVNNILIDPATRRAVSMIDLDTVKPGLAHYDIGDCLRSCCNPAGEETEQWETVRFEADLCRTILKGYHEQAGAFFTEHDYAYLYDAVHLIAFELGLRFLTDYLEGNVYFKVSHREHNLFRALVQFKLAESIEARENTIRTILRELQ